MQWQRGPGLVTHCTVKHHHVGNVAYALTRELDGIPGSEGSHVKAFLGEEVVSFHGSVLIGGTYHGDSQVRGHFRFSSQNISMIAEIHNLAQFGAISEEKMIGMQISNRICENFRIEVQRDHLGVNPVMLTKVVAIPLREFRIESICSFCC